VAEASISAGARPGWLMLAALLLIVFLGLLMLWAEPLIAPVATQQKALLLERAAQAGIDGYAVAGVHGFAWIGIVILLRPMFLLALVVAIEAWLTRGHPRHQDRALAWTARASFLVVTHLGDLMLGRLIHVPVGPLFDFTDAASPTGLRVLEMTGLFLLSMFVADFFQYWAHRAYHRFALLWRFHAVHHAPRNLDVLHKFEHPVEAVVSWFLIAVPANLMIAGVEANQLSLVAAFFLVRDDLIHMKAPINFGPLGLVLVDNRYHFIHHGRARRHYNCNFAGIFPVIDMIFGTYSKPEGEALPETGLDDRLPPARLSQYFLAALPPGEAAHPPDLHREADGKAQAAH
jgi:sterol desaturase/sphingolipid hydroxylase (fatty acid hydroxylase superfamily)